MLLDPSAWLGHGFSFATGLILGSFTNVLVARLPKGQSIVSPASRCPGCEQPIWKRDNIPVIGYLLLGGRCRNCRVPISPRYPAIELLGGLLFLAAELKYGWSPLLFIRDWPFLTILLAVTFIDLENRIIPDRLSLGGLALGLLTSWWAPLGVTGSLVGAALGFGVFYLMAWAYLRATGRSGLGGGDIKLLAMIGAFLGAEGIFATILISSILGSVLGIGWALFNRKKERGEVMTLAIPYGPFLVVGALYFYLFGDTLWLQFTIPT